MCRQPADRTHLPSRPSPLPPLPTCPPSHTLPTPSSLPRHAHHQKPQPRLPYTKSDPDAASKWGHDLFGASVPGGNLAHRLSAAQKIAIRDGTGPSSPSLDLRGKDLLDDDLDLRGNGPNKPRGASAGRASLVDRVGGGVARHSPAATPAGGRPSPAQPSGPGLTIKGKSNRNVVEVSNLDVGTTAEDVKVRCTRELARASLPELIPCPRRLLTSRHQATFESFGKIISSRLGPRHSSSVTVRLHPSNSLEFMPLPRI